jgi:hypothetical protein
MGMISNYTRRSTGVLAKYFEDYFGKTAHVILFIWEIKSHFQPIMVMEGAGYDDVLPTWCCE